MNRRDLLKRSPLLLSFSVAGQTLLMSPSQAQSQGAALSVFEPQQARDLTALANGIAPGAAEAGVSHFIDQQLSRDGQSDCLLMIRYLGPQAPFKDFYIAGLQAAQQAAQTLFKKTIAELSSQQLEQFIGAMASDALNGWQGPPAAFFYFVLRADAIDVCYGTQSGFAQLDVPYMAHIPPTKAW